MTARFINTVWRRHFRALHADTFTMKNKIIGALPPSLLQIKRSEIKKLAVVFLCLSSAFVHADPIDGINILSQSYSGSGSWQFSGVNSDLPLSNNYSGTFGGSSGNGTPLNVSATAPEENFGYFDAPPVNANISINTFSFSSSVVDFPGLSPFTGSDGNEYSLEGQEVFSEAFASWTFQPTCGNLQITLNIGQSAYSGNENLLSVTLATGGNTLLNNNDSSPNPNSPAQADVYSLNSGVTYELIIIGQIQGSDSSADYQNVTCSIESVESAPEPGILKFVSGLAAVWCIQRQSSRRRVCQLAPAPAPRPQVF
jgi:hypothetical protein